MDAMTVQVTKLELKAGDTLVLLCQQVLPSEAHDRVRAMLAPIIPKGARCIILDGGATLAKISAAEAEG
ncbi:MAG TPA: hypothetical protein VEC35_01275 [Noviherbaspirillum sp.]|nr:hypothetical protein [Noviherbaspirillum sp.]